ncbi:MAG: outer membrane protein assembly factor BamC [Gammaproteobacteria bacterium]|jgi:uncharacterized lipoprotein|nr:outer membrane protein assembly factor BamC [Gammaproteobacteria bacterium]MBT7603079.1 outer membrane protein assembly factor BamC [Gammaproteobacteria bacterium]
MRILNNIVSILFFIFLLILAGCSDKPITLEDLSGIGEDIQGIFGKDDSDKYGKSGSIAMLEIPPSLDNPDYSDSLKVPKSVDSTGNTLAFTDAPVLPKYIDMDIRKEGTARWLEIQADPVSLWPYINQFWKAQGFEIAVDKPINGILETDWKKYEMNFEADSNLTNNEDYNYAASKEKFRVRLEREPNGFTNIFLSQHILEADDVIDTKIIWKAKGSDISREAEMLVRMMEYFGISRNIAITSFNDSEKNNKKIYIDLIDFYGVPAILLKGSFSKIWREIGLSLDRTGLLVEDQNRSKAFYVISTNIIENKETNYEIKITKRNNQYIVTAHSASKSKKIKNKIARKILKHIVSAYRSEEVVRN